VATEGAQEAPDAVTVEVLLLCIRLAEGRLGALLTAMAGDGDA
jgi:hypothetical protein